jgi:hypothetical protein
MRLPGFVLGGVLLYVLWELRYLLIASYVATEVYNHWTPLCTFIFFVIILGTAGFFWWALKPNAAPPPSSVASKREFNFAPRTKVVFGARDDANKPDNDWDHGCLEYGHVYMVDTCSGGVVCLKGYGEMTWPMNLFRPLHPVGPKPRFDQGDRVVFTDPDWRQMYREVYTVDICMVAHIGNTAEVDLLGQPPRNRVRLNETGENWWWNEEYFRLADAGRNPPVRPRLSGPSLAWNEAVKARFGTNPPPSSPSRFHAGDLIECICTTDVDGPLKCGGMYVVQTCRDEKVIVEEFPTDLWDAYQFRPVRQ